MLLSNEVLIILIFQREKSMKPKVSVIMPNFNTNKKYLKQSIDSILNQSYANFEFIIIDDCSVNDYEFISNMYKDKRIRLFKNEENLGVAKTLNKCLSLVNGDYIVRMDSDDISIKNRIKIQLNYLINNENVDIVGSSIKYIGEKHIIRRFPENNKDIKASLLFECPIVHPSVMIRTSTVKKYNLSYDENYKSEDYELWTRCAINPNICFYNLQSVLLKYRLHKNQVTKDLKEQIKNNSDLVRVKYINELGLGISREEMILFNRFARVATNFNEEDFYRIDTLLINFIEQLAINNIIEIESLRKVITRKLFKEYLRKAIKRKKAVKSYRKSVVLKDKIFLKCILYLLSLVCNR